MKNCSVFASLISPSKMILFEKKYQTFDTVFHHQLKHLEVRQKLTPLRVVFSTLFSMFHQQMKHREERRVHIAFGLKPSLELQSMLCLV